MQDHCRNHALLLGHSNCRGRSEWRLGPNIHLRRCIQKPGGYVVAHHTPLPDCSGCTEWRRIVPSSGELHHSQNLVEMGRTPCRRGRRSQTVDWAADDTHQIPIRAPYHTAHMGLAGPIADPSADNRCSASLAEQRIHQAGSREGAGRSSLGWKTVY
jgi:hypothetical protein